MDSQLKANILDAFGLAGLSPAEQDEAVEKIGATVFQSVIVRTLESMSEAEQSKLDAKLEETGDSPEALLAALRESVPNFQELVQSEIARLADESRRILSPEA